MDRGRAVERGRGGQRERGVQRSIVAERRVTKAAVLCTEIPSPNFAFCRPQEGGREGHTTRLSKISSPQTPLLSSPLHAPPTSTHGQPPCTIPPINSHDLTKEGGKWRVVFRSHRSNDSHRIGSTDRVRVAIRESWGSFWTLDPGDGCE